MARINLSEEGKKLVSHLDEELNKDDWTETQKAKAKWTQLEALKSRLAKFDSTSAGKTNEETETAIRQVIDKALVTEQVIDVFDAAGIKKPVISILSEEFLLEVKQQQKLLKN